MENPKIKIYIVEDYLLTRITYRHSLPKFNTKLEIINDFENAESCIDALNKEEVDLILMDLGLPGMNGIEATKKIKSINKNIKIIILTSHESEDEVLASLVSGANAYALKDTPPETLATVIESVNKGALWLDPRIAQIAMNIFRQTKFANENMDNFNLTTREKEVLRFMTDGMSNTEIAKEMIISHNTVKAHIGNIFEKLAVNDRVRAAVIATECKYNRNYGELNVH